MKNTGTYLVGVLTVCVITMAATCKKAVVEVKPACNPMPTYTADIKPIIDQNCGTKCHSAQWHADGIELTSYELVKKESQKDRFLGSLNHAEGYTAMPKKAPKFSDSLLKVITCWVKSGSPE